MVRKIRLSPGNSPYVGHLASGCRLCMKGAKLVLLVTGRCSKGCFYCPLSAERRGRDVIYANEVRVDKVMQAVTEAKMIDAEGMGITGGEPILELQRTCHYLRVFKKEFGPTFHIHLYTALEPISPNAVKQLLQAGLDELRLHRFTAGEDLPLLRQMTIPQTTLGVEIPAIPGQLNSLKQLLLDLEKAQVDFVNINELEFAPLNAAELHRRGLMLDPDSVAAVRGSEDTAIELLEWAAEKTSLNVHYCPLALKDGTQLRNRFRRRAKHVAKAFESISREGLLVKGVVIPPEGVPLTEAFDLLRGKFHVPAEQLWINTIRNQLETSVSVVRRLANSLKRHGFSVGIAEVYPIEGQFQVTYVPL